MVCFAQTLKLEPVIVVNKIWLYPQARRRAHDRRHQTGLLADSSTRKENIRTTS